MNAPDLNPYSPPSAILQPVLDSDDLVYQPASKGKRFLTYFLDRFAVLGFAMGVGLVLAVLEEANLIHGFIDWIENISSVQDFVFTALLSVVYYVGMESLFSRSLGKLITGTKVLSEAGLKPSFLSIVGRSFARLVPFEAFSFLGERGWHDSWSGTQVVDVRKPKIAVRQPTILQQHQATLAAARRLRR